MDASSDLAGLVSRFRVKKVLVLGDLMLDTYLSGSATRISPEAPVPVVKLSRRDDRLGGAANCAMNIAALGGIPLLFGLIGTNEAGSRFLKLVRENHFDDYGIIADEHVTTIRKIRVVAETQQIVRVDEEDPSDITNMLLDEILGKLREKIPEAAAVAISDYAKGLMCPSLMSAVLDLARMNRIPVLVDPKPVNMELYKGCDLLKPNRKEISETTGIQVTDDETCDRAADLVMKKFTPRALLVTRGPDGMHLYRDGEKLVRIKTRVSHVFDVSGAGDTVLAALSLSYASGLDPVRACELASHAASVAVRKPGTSTVSPDELVASIRNNSN